MERVNVFIDGNNFYFSLKRNNRSTRVDYHQLSLALTGPDRKLVQTFYYNVAYDKNLFPDKAKAQLEFLDTLEQTPYLNLRLGRLVQSQNGGFQEKGVSSLLAADLIYQAARQAFDIAVVITEDKDYASTLEKVKEFGKQVELACFQDGQNRDLTRASDLFVPIEMILEKYSSRIFPAAPENQRGNPVERIDKIQRAFRKRT